MTASGHPFKKSFLLQPEWMMAVGITLLAAWLNVFFLVHAGGFWRDEINLINLAAHHSLGDMAKDSFPVLMPLVVHGWSSLGLANSELGLRSLGTLIGLGIIVALWAAAWTARRSPPLLGLALLAVNSTVIASGDSIRAYGLGSLMIVLAAAAAWTFLKKPSSLRAGIFAAAAVASVQTLFQNAILIAAVCAGVFAVCARRKNWRSAVQILAAGMAAAASLLPYLPVLVSGRTSGDVWRTGLQVKPALDNLTIAIGFPYGQYRYAWGALALAVIAAGCRILPGDDSKIKASADEATGPAKSPGEAAPKNVRLFAGTTLLAALVGFAGFLWFAALPAQPWYFLPFMALATVCFDAGLPPPTKILRAALLSFVAATAALGGLIATQDLNYRFTNIDLWARALMAETSPEDFVIVTPWYCGVSFDHYFKSPTPWTTVPPLPDHSAHRYDLVKIQMQQTNVIQPVLEKIAATLKAGHRVWILASVGWMSIPAAGEPTPANLPPPPLPSSGWTDTPYVFNWTSQIAHALGNHSFKFERVDNPVVDMHIAENTELFVATGWKNSDPPNPRAAPR